MDWRPVLSVRGRGRTAQEGDRKVSSSRVQGESCCPWSSCSPRSGCRRVRCGRSRRGGPWWEMIFIIVQRMAFQLDSKVIRWLSSIQIITQADCRQTGTSSFEIKEALANAFENGTKVAQIVQEIYKKSGLPLPQSLNHLKVSNQTAAQLYNWNILNEALKKIDFEIDPETKNMVINGDRFHLAMVLRQLHDLYSQQQDDFEDSLETEQFKRTRQPKPVPEPTDNFRESLTLSKSEEQPAFTPVGKKSSEQLAHLQKLKRPDPASKSSPKAEGDLLQYVIEQLMSCISLNRKQAIALLSDNNKYLAHIFVKGVKNEFAEIEQLMERWFRRIDFIVQKMIDQNDMCFFFLQVVKPALLSKSEEVAQWGCRILSKIAHELANQDMLPLAYDWFVREAGGLATTILALSRHPKLNQHVVGYILEFARFNVAELFTVELKKITSNDQMSYIKFMLLIFDPLVDSKLSAEELLTSGAIDYWVETCLKGAESSHENSVEMRLYCIEFLTKLWRAYPLHIEETLDKVNEIMGYIKRGIRESSEVMRYTLLELLFNLLDEFASKRNPYASIVYKKITFLFIENHEELNIREFMLRNFSSIISKYPTIPIEIFLEPFVKQVKIRESKSYFLNIFDMEFINVVVNHRKLKPEIALELFDLLAKTKLNNYEFAPLADRAMDTLLDRFIEEDIFFEYTSKLVKISLAILYSTLKERKSDKTMSDQERLHAQKRAEIINFIISLVERGSSDLNERIKEFVIHLKIEIQRKLNKTHKGIERILEMFPNVERDVSAAVEKINNKDELESNMTSNASKDGLFPKLEPKYLSKDRDEVSSQQSNHSQGTQYSKISSKQEFPQKDYTKFAEEDEQKFLKENGIGFKKKNLVKKPVIDKEVDPKVQEQLLKAKQRKEEEERKRIEEKEKISKRKEALQNKIQKELEQRNLMQGIKGFEKDVEVKVLFQENEINEKLLEDDQQPKNINISQEEIRDCESVKLIIKKYSSFIRKLFNKYSSSKVNKKDFFDQENENMNQIDLIRLCKEKGLEKNKQIIIELLKSINDKNTKNVSLEGFFKFLEALVAFLFLKEKCSTHFPMGDFLKTLLKKMAIGENFKLEEDEDETMKNLTEKVKYNPHIVLPQNYKKIYERVYEPKRQCSYPTKNAIKKESFLTCFEVVNDLLFNVFKFHTLEEEVRFFEEARVVKKPNLTLPPRPARKEKEEPINLLEDKETAPALKKRVASNMNKSASNRPETNASNERQKEYSKPKAKVVNAAEKKKLQQEQAKRFKKQQEDEEFKKRQQEIKKRFEKMQEEKEKEKSKQKEDTKVNRDQQEDKKKKQKEEKEKYHQQQREKLQKYKREKEEKEKEDKDKQKEVKSKEEEERKEKLKIQMKREEEKRKEQNEKMKKEREVSQDKNKKKKEEQEKKKELLKKQVLKKLEGEKEKYEIQKLYKELMKKIFQESDVQGIFNDYKEELKSLYNYGKEFNEYKLGEDQNALEQRGWMNICQQFNLCDNTNANNLLKQNQKEKGRAGFIYEEFLENLMSLAVKREIQSDLDDYEKAHKSCSSKLQKYLKNLKIPKDKLSIKDYFVSLKNNIKKKQELQVTAPNGQKQTWEVQQK